MYRHGSGHGAAGGGAVVRSWTIEITQHGEISTIMNNRARKTVRHEFIDPGTRLGGTVFGKMLRITLNAHSEQFAEKFARAAVKKLCRHGKWELPDRRAFRSVGRRKRDRQ